uniref:Uncharacterized protein n=1 Tax=Arundo donax TaxID=35708 RepID=A0A0A9DE77_ARUDO
MFQAICVSCFLQNSVSLLYIFNLANICNILKWSCIQYLIFPYENIEIKNNLHRFCRRGGCIVIAF